MPVTFLELENFKSYAGVQKIGPFQSFTSIIGPNGSGKSNVMDALSFVLGVQSRDLRSSQMKDLIFRPPGTTKSKKGLKASASLYYQEHETAQELQFQRVISASGVGDYRFNGTSVTYKEYEQHLADIGVLVKARNFLVFQGDVETLARKSPAEFVELVENISQSIDFKEPYERALREKEQAEAATLFCYNKQKGMKGERRVLKEQKEEAERFHSLLDRKSSLATNLYLWQLYHMHIDRTEREARLLELQAELQEKTQEDQEHANILKEKKKEASVARRQTQAADKHRVQLAAEAGGLEPSIIEATETIKNYDKKMKHDQTTLEKKKVALSTHADKLQQLEDDIAESQKDLGELEQDYASVKRDAAPDQVTLTQAQEVEYERVREAAAAASVEPRRTLATTNKKLESARAKAADVTAELATVKGRRAEVAREVKELSERTEKLSKVSKKPAIGRCVYLCISIYILPL
jgi:structural maintenance of chromosome 1